MSTNVDNDIDDDDDDDEDDCPESQDWCDDCDNFLDECKCTDDDPDSVNEYEDERRAKVGTSECDGTCQPQCKWCLVSHECPTDCAGGPCPYESLKTKDEP